MGAERPEGKCAICAKETKTRCSACQEVFYCCVEHQKSDWNKHKTLCHPFKIESDELVGRYLVATKDIKAGDIVLKEGPVLWGPNQVTPPVCVGCLDQVNPKDRYTTCPKCGWLLCSIECADKPGHLGECMLTQGRGSKVDISQFYNPHPAYQFLLVVRGLMLKETDPKKYKVLMKLEPHHEERKANGQYETDKMSYCEIMPKFFKCVGKWTEEEIMKVVGVLQVNGHEIPLNMPASVAVYDAASMVEHSCQPNLTKSFTKKGDVVFWAPNPIKKGERLSICYTDTMWGTLPRREHLIQTKYFTCSCARCQDPTEFGTHFSSLKCLNTTCDGLIIPRFIDDYDENKAETCTVCGDEMTYKEISETIRRATADVAAMDKSDELQCQKCLHYYKQWLAPNHHLLTEVRISLAQILGDATTIQTIDDEKLNLKLKLCQDLIPLIKTVAPAESRLFGLIYFEQHAALAELARRGCKNKNPNFVSAYEESLLCAEKVLHYLRHEPICLPEGRVYKQAKINVESLKMMLLQQEVPI